MAAENRAERRPFGRALRNEQSAATRVAFNSTCLNGFAHWLCRTDVPTVRVITEETTIKQYCREFPACKTGTRAFRVVSGLQTLAHLCAAGRLSAATKRARKRHLCSFLSCLGLLLQVQLQLLIAGLELSELLPSVSHLPLPLLSQSLQIGPLWQTLKSPGLHLSPKPSLPTIAWPAKTSARLLRESLEFLPPKHLRLESSKTTLQRV